MITFALALVILALALGAFSSLVFVWQWMIGGPTLISTGFILIIVAAASVKLFLYLKRRIPHPRASNVSLMAPFALAFSFAMYWIVLHGKVFQHGFWDAWAVWNLHARFLYRGAEGSWREVFDPVLRWSQNDYPLLLPGLVNGTWMIAGSEHLLVPAFISKLFALLAIGIVCTAVCALSKDQRGWLAGLIVLASPSFLTYSSAQMADIPLSVYILTTIVLLEFARAWPEAKPAFLILAGVSAGLAAWTKNEGLAFVFVLLLSRLLLQRKDLTKIALGLAPLLVLRLSFSAILAGPGSPPSSFERLTEFETYLQIAKGFVHQFVIFGDVPGHVHPAILMGLYVLLFWRPITRITSESLSLLAVPVLMLGGYFANYTLTPYDLRWHLENSLDRLLLQVWPMCVFIVSMLPLFMAQKAAGFDSSEGHLLLAAQGVGGIHSNRAARRNEASE